MKGYLGCDPGKEGGLALIIPGSCPFALRMPETERDLWDSIRDISKLCDGNVIAAIEQVHSMPRQGVASTFTFGRGYGGLRMAILAAGIPFVDVTPQKWQKAIGCLTGGDKKVSLAKAQQLFPTAEWKGTQKYKLAIADALLIAEWLRQQP